MSTYKPMQSITLPSPTTSVTFSGIDQGYTDLIIIASYTTVSADANTKMFFNGDSSSGLYSKIQLESFSTTSTSSGTSNANFIGFESNIGTDTVKPSTQTVHIFDYSSSVKHKTSLIKQQGFMTGATGLSARAGLWRNTAPITSVTISTSGTNYNIGSTFDLYGIKSGAPQALGGDLVTTDGNYWYHTFRTSGTFTPLKSLSADYLVVAGGGGASGGGTTTQNQISGGGGAGGLRSTLTNTGGLGSLESALSVTGNVVYTITVGAGGAAGPSNQSSPPPLGSQGSNSSIAGTGIATITSTGGGFGATQFGLAHTGGSGGSGGGGGSGGVAGTRTASPVQGFNGGAGGVYVNPGYSGGGGGGAGAAGTAGNSTSGNGVGGNGGNGIQITAFSTATGTGANNGYYAGGGGGGNYGGAGTAGTGGLGGGGNASINGAGTSGTVNTGGGGGSGGSGFGGLPPAAGAGGSGIVIVRYPV